MRRELGEKYDEHVKNKPDLTVIKNIMAEQEKAMRLNDDARYWQVYNQDIPIPTVNESWGLVGNTETIKQTTVLPIKWYIILIDDCLQYLKSYQSDISLIGTWSRHREITIVWVAQIYKRLPSSIRAMLDISVLFYMYPLSDTAFDELFNKKDLDLFRTFYKKWIQDGSRFSFIVIDKRAKKNGSDCGIMFEDGESKNRFFVCV